MWGPFPREEGTQEAGSGIFDDPPFLNTEPHTSHRGERGERQASVVAHSQYAVVVVGATQK
eukprot:scaffold302570_cov26-Tisochrysis_lutea.AAC.1